MARNLTAATIANAAVPAGKKQAEIFDSNTRGLSLVVSAGGTKSWFLTFSDPATGKRARRKIGRYPELSLAAAREKAREGRGQVADGMKPLPPPPPPAMTVAELVETFVGRGMRGKRSQDAVARRLRRNVSATELGAITLDRLTAAHVTRALDRMVDRGAETEANICFRNIRTMLRWARGRGDLDSDVLFSMQPPAESRTKERYLSADEVATFWKAAEAELRDGTARLLKFVLATGCRIGEAAGMRFDEIEGDVWTIPADRVKNGRPHRLPLTRTALEIIEEQRTWIATHYARRDRNPGEPVVFVFPAPGGMEPIGPNAASRALNRVKTIGPDNIERTLRLLPFTPHDLRRTMATHLAIAGKNDFEIGLVLNHISTTKSSITSSVYIRHDYLSEKHSIMTLWDHRLRELVGLPPPAEPAD